MDAATPVWIVSRTMLADREADLSLRWKRVLKTWELDDIHDLRVASRRLREGLALFAPLYGRNSLSRILKPVKSLTSSLGEMRNTDEALLYFGALSQRLSAPDRDELSLLMDSLAAVRLQEQERLHRHLESLSLRKVSGAIRRTVSAPRIFRAPAAVDPFIPFVLFARTAERERFAPLPQLLSEAVAEENRDAQHQLRIAVKRYRYRLELLSPLLGDRFPEIHAAVRRYQETLGTLHDLDVFSTMIGDSPLSEGSRNTITGLLAQERKGRYDEFMEMHGRCSLLDLGQQVEGLL